MLQEKDDEKFRSLTARMSCLMTIAEMRRESEVSKLIDIINELKMAQKYLILCNYWEFQERPREDD